jgi:hypothetical protein
MIFPSEAVPENKLFAGTFYWYRHYGIYRFPGSRYGLAAQLGAGAALAAGGIQRKRTL